MGLIINHKCLEECTDPLVKKVNQRAAAILKVEKRRSVGMTIFKARWEDHLRINCWGLMITKKLARELTINAL